MTIRMREIPEPTSCIGVMSTGTKEVLAHKKINRLVLEADQKDDYGWWREGIPEETEEVDHLVSCVFLWSCPLYQRLLLLLFSCCDGRWERHEWNHVPPAPPPHL